MRPAVPAYELTRLADAANLYTSETPLPGFETIRSCGFACFDYRGRTWKIANPSRTNFSAVGSLDEFRSTCGNCPHGLRAPAACTGNFSYSDLPETLDDLIARRELMPAIEAAGLASPSIWHTLWAESPVPRPTLGVLQRLFEKIDKPRVGLFRQAIAASFRLDLALHAEMSPPGHIDFGVYTIFPHCPRCKLEAPVPRWSGRNLSETMTCENCGTAFSPEETSNRLPDHDANELTDDDERIGFDHKTPIPPLDVFTYQVRMLEQQGVPEETAMEVVVASRQNDLRLKAGWAVDAFLVEVLFDGLTPIGHKPGWQHFYPKMFRPELTGLVWGKAEIECIIQRAEERNISVLELAWVPKLRSEPERVVCRGNHEPLRDLRGLLKTVRPMRKPHRYRVKLKIDSEDCGNMLPEYLDACHKF